MPTLDHEVRASSVPPQALLLSLLSLWIPVAASSAFPEWTNSDVGILVWLLALIPPFLLSYYRGWKGASVALASAMAAFTAAQVVVTAIGAAPPTSEIMLGIIVVLIAVTLGSGVLASLFHRSLGEAEKMALTDPGTGLPNRRHGMMHLQRAFAAAHRGSPASVVMFDLDRFKRVNDRFGHPTGDEVLRVFAGILGAETRGSHLSLRFGGEEFMTVLDGCDARAASVFAERVLTRLRDHEFSWGRLTVSAGVSEYEDGMASPDVLIAAADQALYRGKERGGDQVVVLARQGTTSTSIVTPPQVDDPAGDGDGELVLIVDDDPAVLRTLSRSLRRRRYQPLEASDPVRALQIVRGLDEPLDLIITDVVMPEMSGFRLVEMLLDIQPGLRALYISGYSSEEVRWSGVPGAVKSFLPKPISLDALTGAVHGILRTPIPHGAAVPAATEPEPLALEDRLEATSAQLDEAYSELLVRLAWTAEYRDDTTGKHAERVGRLAGMLASRLVLPEIEAGRIEQAAPLHDLGKVAIPDAILRKPSSLTHTEREIVQRHCSVGASLLAGSRHPLLQEAERIARSHHERWDGQGYPDGLAGDQIPQSARITAVADAFDTLTESRPYRAAVGWAEALERIQQDRGTHFDPDVVDALLELAEEDAFQALTRIDLAGKWLGPRPALTTVRSEIG